MATQAGFASSVVKPWQPDLVVSNADSAWTYRHLLPPEARSRWTDRRIERSRYSMGLFVLVFRDPQAVSRRRAPYDSFGAALPGVAGGHFQAQETGRDFSLYLHRPTATDPSLAPAGCDGFYVLSPVPHNESGVDWQEQGELYRQAIMRRLSETLLPDLEENLVTSHFVTPDDFANNLLAFRGAAFGLEPVFQQSAWFRPHNRSEEVGGLYMVGAGTHPGAGVPGVLSSARVLDSVVPDAASVKRHV